MNASPYCFTAAASTGIIRALIYLIVAFSLSVEYSQARTYSYWGSEPISAPRYISPVDGCDDTFNNIFPHMAVFYRPELSWYDSSYGNGRQKFICGDRLDPPSNWAWFIFYQKTCPNDQVFDFIKFQCVGIGLKGSQNQIASCPSQQSTPGSFAGNPINILSGNKVQKEYDLQNANAQGLDLYRTYNSFDGVWTHNFSTRLEVADDSIVFTTSDGSSSIFWDKSGVYESNSNAGHLQRDSASDGWIYTSPRNDRYQFRSDGRMVNFTDAEGYSISLSYKNTMIYMIVEITNGAGQKITIGEDVKHQIMTASSPTISLTYAYAYEVLQSVTKIEGSTRATRRYIYETPYSSILLGVEDERGIRVATWAYDGLRRATSSEHANGAERTEVEYGDGYTKVKNSLGKATIYRYQKIGDLNRIVAIEGEPSPRCPASNTSYTYNDRGQVLTKTDAKGLITTYTYNDRGLETSRTEASGTALARTVTTEWDATRFLPVRVVEPDLITVYTYDAQGRELSRQTTSH